MNEHVIREKLIKKLTKEHPKNTEFLAELPVDNFSRRIDLVMANGQLSGFEIKSERDSLIRLEGQLETYLKYFENITVVCATKHLENVIKMVDSKVGVWEFDGKYLIEHQKAIYQSLTKSNWLSFLNIAGLKQLLRYHQCKVSGVKEDLIERALSLSEKQIRTFLLAYLKQQFPLIQERRLLVKKERMSQFSSSRKLNIEIRDKALSDLTLNEEEFLTLPSGLKVRPMLNL